MILNKQVGVYLNLVHNRFKLFITTLFQRHGHKLTPEQFLLLDALWDGNVLSQQQIADTILKDKNSIVKLIDGLEKKGLVRRVEDKNDRRQNLIEVTDKALEVKDEISEIAMQTVNIIVKDIPKEELNTFIKVLSKMADNMSKEPALINLQGVKKATNSSAK